MSTPDLIKVLVVDDLADKRLVYQSILEEPGQVVVTAASGAEALASLLREDFAVILLDVNMPIMDGIETATLIRSRKRCAHTPIIFVTAHSDEVHSLRGYAIGAVDYVLTPVVPEILRTKVRVFVELFRKTRQIERQAETLRELQAREHRRQLRETVDRLDLALDAGRMGAFEWDTGSELLSWTPTLEAIFGFTPGQFSGRAGDLEQRLHPSDRERVVNTLIDAVKSRSPFRLEHRIIRTTGEIAWVEVRGKIIEPDEGADPAAATARLVGVCLDISERKRTEADKSHLAAIVESSDDAILSVSIDGIIESWNAGAERLLGYTAREAIGTPISRLIPAERAEEEGKILERIRVGERLSPFETVRVAKGGKRIDMALTVSPIHDATGHVVGASKVARDITERRRVEAELERHRVHLEDLVRERTAELEASHARLRLADRLASIGTLAAGLGHDMGNLLLPMRMRLSTLERADLPESSREDVVAIAEACEYLKRLSRGLRLFALSPEDQNASGERTEVAAWWSEVTPFLRNALPRAIRFESDVSPSTPDIRISPHMLTQAVYNLVQNAGDVMREHADGEVRLRVAGREDGQVLIEVSDNGPGMSEEVMRRCMEPFYTTKTRGISTGLGLALVRGAVHKAGGTIEVVSRPGLGATFRLVLPAAAKHDLIDPASLESRAVCVSLNDARLSAYVSSVLRSLKVKIVPGPWHAARDTSLVVLDRIDGRKEELRTFLEGDASRIAVLIGESGELEASAQVVPLGPAPSAVQIRAGLSRLLSPQQQGALS